MKISVISVLLFVLGIIAGSKVHITIVREDKSVCMEIK